MLGVDSTNLFLTVNPSNVPGEDNTATTEGGPIVESDGHTDPVPETSDTFGVVTKNFFNQAGLIGIGIHVAHGRARVARATAPAAVTVIVDEAAVVALDEQDTAVAGEAASAIATRRPARASSDFADRLGQAEPIIVGGVPYGPEALLAQLLRHAADSAWPTPDGRPARIALAHDDDMDAYRLDLLRQAVRLAGIGDVALIDAAIAASHHPDDLATGAALWAIAQDDGRPATASVTGTPHSARNVLIGAGSGGAILGAGGLAANAGAGGTGASGADATLGDFAAPASDPSTLADFASTKDPSSIADFASTDSRSMSDFTDPNPTSMTTSTPPINPKPRIPRVPAAIGAIAVAAAIVGGAVLASSGDDDETQVATDSSATIEATSTTAAQATGPTSPPDNERLATPFLFACGGVGYGGEGTGGPAKSASCGSPRDVEVASDGKVYFLDQRTRGDEIPVVRVVATDGTIEFIDFGEVDGKALDHPTQLELADDGSMFVADYENYRILKRTPSGTVTRLAGKADGSAAGHVGTGSDDKVADGATADEIAIGNVSGMTLDDDGNLYLSDSHNDIIQKIDTSGTITIIAGKNRTAGDRTKPVPANDANLTSWMGGDPRSLAVDSDGTLYIAGAFDLFRIKDGVLEDIAGTGDRPDDGDPREGPAKEVPVDIAGIAVPHNGDLLIATHEPYFDLRTLSAGSFKLFAGGDKPAPSAGPTATRFSPGALALDDVGRVYIAEPGTGYNMVRRLPAEGVRE